MIIKFRNEMKPIFAYHSEYVTNIMVGPTLLEKKLSFHMRPNTLVLGQYKIQDEVGTVAMIFVVGSIKMQFRSLGNAILYSIVLKS